MMRSLFILFTFLICLQLAAQTPGSPQGFNYSAVARDASGKVLANKNITLKLNILKDNPAGAVLYSEKHSLTTDGYGLFALIVGSGTVQNGNLNSINWGSDKHYLQMALDANGGTNFVTMGSTQLLSVPYALHANIAQNGIKSISNTGDTLYLNDGRLFGLSPEKV